MLETISSLSWYQLSVRKECTHKEAIHLKVRREAAITAINQSCA